jgi:hypothetical protein
VAGRLAGRGPVTRSRRSGRVAVARPRPPGAGGRRRSRQRTGAARSAGHHRRPRSDDPRPSTAECGHRGRRAVRTDPKPPFDRDDGRHRCTSPGRRTRCPFTHRLWITHGSGSRSYPQAGCAISPASTPRATPTARSHPVVPPLGSARSLERRRPATARAPDPGCPDPSRPPVGTPRRPRHVLVPPVHHIGRRTVARSGSRPSRGPPPVPNRPVPAESLSPPTFPDRHAPPPRSPLRAARPSAPRPSAPRPARPSAPRVPPLRSTVRSAGGHPLADRATYSHAGTRSPRPPRDTVHPTGHPGQPRRSRPSGHHQPGRPRPAAVATAAVHRPGRSPLVRSLRPSPARETFPPSSRLAAGRARPAAEGRPPLQATAVDGPITAER